MNYTLIPGQSHTASEEETMSMIRSVLTENVDTAPEQAPAPAVQKPVQQAFVERTTDSAPRRRADDLPELAEVEAEARPRNKRIARVSASLLRPVKAVAHRVRTFQPTTRHIGLALSALLFVLRPHWFVIGAVLAVIIVAGTFLMLGADRIWRGVLAWLDRVEARDPARASDLRGRLDTFAYRWDAVLDIFPDGMVDALYMPDFQAMQQADIDHEQVVNDRLDRMVQES